MENMGYEVKIGDNIHLKSKAVTSVSFKIDTIDENVKDRSENVINVVTVKGFITPETKDETNKLMLWALERKSGEVYKKVEITIRVNEDSQIRKYLMDKVFCIDYTEKFDSQNTNGSEYELKIAQRKDNLSGIRVIS